MRGHSSATVREGPKTRDSAERLMVVTGHVFKDVMADCHPHGVAGEVAEITPSLWDFGQFWKKYGANHTGVSSAVSS